MSEVLYPSEGIRLTVSLLHHDLGDQMGSHAALPGQPELFREVVIYMCDRFYFHYYLKRSFSGFTVAA